LIGSCGSAQQDSRLPSRVIFLFCSLLSQNIENPFEP
jgi:hypothetical protein